MNNELLQHIIQTIRYRFKKSVHDYDENFGEFHLGRGTRTTVEIINHMYHVLYSTRVFIEEERFNKNTAEKLILPQEIHRFNIELNTTKLALSNIEELPIEYAKKLIQGPFSDILTHIGQIAMMQRLDGRLISGEDFSQAKIE